MPKRFSSKIANQAAPPLFRSPNQERSQLDANTIEEVAKIFMQTQANMVNNKTTTDSAPQANTSQEMLVLLQQINSKLENLQKFSPASGSLPNQPQQSSQQDNSQQQQQHTYITTTTTTKTKNYKQNKTIQK